jgi:hypothetical protein
MRDPVNTAMNLQVSVNEGNILIICAARDFSRKALHKSTFFFNGSSTPFRAQASYSVP